MSDRDQHQSNLLFHAVFPGEDPAFAPHTEFFSEQELWWKRGLNGPLEIISQARPLANIRALPAAERAAAIARLGHGPRRPAALTRSFLHHRKQLAIVDIERFPRGLCVARGVENRWMDFARLQPRPLPVAPPRTRNRGDRS